MDDYIKATIDSIDKQINDFERELARLRLLKDVLERGRK